MNSNFFYPSCDHIIRIHNSVMKKTNQENKGLLQDKDVSQTSDHVQNDFYYPDVYSKLAYYMFSLLMNHYFVDGNKRVALGVIKLFMVLNGIHVPSIFLDTIEAAIMMVASSMVGKEFLQSYFEMIISGVPDETVQLKIFNYLSNSDS